MLNGAPLCKHLSFENDELLAIEECHSFDAATSIAPFADHSTPIYSGAVSLSRTLDFEPDGLNPFYQEVYQVGTWTMFRSPK
jgi:hypothetical protein